MDSTSEFITQTSSFQLNKKAIFMDANNNFIAISTESDEINTFK